MSLAPASHFRGTAEFMAPELIARANQNAELDSTLTSDSHYQDEDEMMMMPSTATANERFSNRIEP